MKEWMKKDWLKKLAVAVGFTIVFIGSLLLMSFVFTPQDNDPDNGMLDWEAKAVLAEPNDSIDAIILGDSEAYCAFSPLYIWEQQGITTYNCSTSRQTLKYSEELLHDACSKHSPKIVFLETDRIFKSPILWGWVTRQLIPTFSVLTYHNRWKTMSSDEVGAQRDYTHVCELKGYKFSVEINPADASRYMSETTKSEYVNLINRNYIKKMKAYCEEHGAKLVLVSTPSTTNWDMKKHNGIAKLSEQLGLEYIDMNLLPDEIPINWETDTRDGGDHMNNAGAEKVSAYIGQYLANTGLFENKKTDGAYAQWNEALSKFNEQKSEAEAEAEE